MLAQKPHMATFIANNMQAYLANIIVIEVQLGRKLAVVACT